MKSLKSSEITEIKWNQVKSSEIRNLVHHFSSDLPLDKYNLYRKFNPALIPLNKQDSKIFTQKFIRLRLSSHSFPIETGRWSRKKREERLCTVCNVLGDEIHYIYHCTYINRNNLTDIPDLCNLGTYGKLNLLLYNLGEYL